MIKIRDILRGRIRCFSTVFKLEYLNYSVFKFSETRPLRLLQIVLDYNTISARLFVYSPSRTAIARKRDISGPSYTYIHTSIDGLFLSSHSLLVTRASDRFCNGDTDAITTDTTNAIITNTTTIIIITTMTVINKDIANIIIIIATIIVVDYWHQSLTTETGWNILNIQFPRIWTNEA